MTTLDRTILASVGSIAVAVSIIAFSPASDGKQPVVERTGDELCTEVKYELNRSVKDGMLTRERADAIAERCFKLYGGTTL